MVRLQRPRHKLIVKNEIANYTPLLSLIHFLIPRTLTHEKKQEREREGVEKSAVRYIYVYEILEFRILLPLTGTFFLLLLLLLLLLCTLAPPKNVLDGFSLISSYA